MVHAEQQYLDLLRDLLDAPFKDDRTNTGTRTKFVHNLRFDLSKGFPLFTTKKVFFRGVAEELFWFLSGSTRIRPLLEKGVHIWTEWCYEPYKQAMIESGEKYLTMPQFEERILNDQPFEMRWGDLGRVYGSQWRDYGRCEDEVVQTITNGKSEVKVPIGYFVEPGFDQITWLINEIKQNPNSRRLIVHAWNPKEHLEKNEAKLPPCHLGFQVVIIGGKLNLHFKMRSTDSFLGLSFNVASYGLVQMLLSAQTGYEPGELCYTGTDVHLYENHIEQAKLQITREPRPFPTLKIREGVKSIFDYTFDDLELIGYDPHPAIKATVAV